MNHQLLAKIKGNPQLPSLPAVAVRVLELAKQTNASLATVAKVISSDPALTAKVLKTVNSSFYGLPHQVSTISHALVLLGMQTVKTLALGFSLAGSLNSRKSSHFDYVRFWRQSLFSAVAARTLAKMLRTGEPEEAFLAGLLSDIGTLAMHRGLGADYDILLEKCGGDQVELVRLSREKFDLDHAQVGGALAEDWKFPPAMVEPIRQHHALAKTGNGPIGLVEIVYAGVLCGQVFAAKRAGLLERAKRELSTRFKLENAKILAIFKEIDSHTEELADLFEVTIQPGRGYLEIEQEARQTLIELTLQTQFQSQELARQNERLQQRAATDGLTGLANRSGFAQFLENAFADFRNSGTTFSLLLLDLDKFKSVNDAHGHQAGDEVLQRIGRLLRSLIEPGDLAARYGGEEMALVLNRKDCAGAMAMAERVRAAIQSERIIFEGKSIPVTASVGVATAASQAGFGSPDDLIGAADRALYAAKEAGRNCVRHCALARHRGAA